MKKVFLFLLTTSTFSCSTKNVDPKNDRYFLGDWEMSFSNQKYYIKDPSTNEFIAPQVAKVYFQRDGKAIFKLPIGESRTRSWSYNSSTNTLTLLAPEEKLVVIGTSSKEFTAVYDSGHEVYFKKTQ